MEKEYKLIEELQGKYGKELNYKIYKCEWESKDSRYIEIKGIYTVDNNIIDKIKEYTNDYCIKVNYKRLGLVLTINLNEE